MAYVRPKIQGSPCTLDQQGKVCGKEAPGQNALKSPVVTRLPQNSEAWKPRTEVMLFWFKPPDDSILQTVGGHIICQRAMMVRGL